MSEKFFVRSVKGMRDIFEKKYIKKFDLVFDISRLISRLYGYSFVESPILEHAELFVRSVGELSDVSKELYAFVDKDKEMLSLRPEFTASIARLVVENSLQINVPLKLFSYGSVFRRDRPQKNRYRQFYQVNFENIGISNYKSDAEMIIMLCDLLRRIGVSKDKFFIKINSLGSLDTIRRYTKMLNQYLTDKKSELSEVSLSRLDSNPLRILDSKEKEDANLIKNSPQISECYSQEDKEFFFGVKDVLEHAGVEFTVDPMLVRGLDYYSSVVFEFIMKDSNSRSQNSFVGGGRYNKLFSKLTSNKVDLDACGCAIGVDRIINLMDDQEKEKEIKIAALPADDCCRNYFFKVISILRDKNLEVFSFFDGHLNKRLSKVVKRNFTHAIIIGALEEEKGTLILRDLCSSKQKEFLLSNINDVLEEL